jgi:malonyl-CoA decarboxylase
MNMTFQALRSSNLQKLLSTVILHGRTLRKHAARPWTRTSAVPPLGSVAALKSLCEQLLSGRGEASGVALATEICEAYKQLGGAEKAEFFICLAEEYGPDWNDAREAWNAHEQSDSPENFRRLIKALEPPRQELFRRINHAPDGTAALVAMRTDLLNAAPANSRLRVVDDDLTHLLQSWFNRGFLVMQRIDWSTPADLLEHIIRYEAVHEINDWEELRRRLLPADRRCYAFFHPSLADDPLIFVEVALTREMPGSIQSVLDKGRVAARQDEATTAVFYSISNCQPGLKGISFGHFLIKQVVEELSRELPNLKTFVTLSPVPDFRNWLDTSDVAAAAFEEDKEASALFRQPDWPENAGAGAALEPLLMRLAAHYFLKARDDRGRSVDQVARFHLGNGARLERLCWLGDTSPKGLATSAGLMVNYLYKLDQVEANHEAYAKDNSVMASGAVKQLLLPRTKRKGTFGFRVR